MHVLLLILCGISLVSSSFLDWFRGTTTTPQYNAYGGCPSTGCVPPTIVPRTNGFWPNADILTGLQIEQQSQNQNQNSNQNTNSNPNVSNPQQDDPRTGPTSSPGGSLSGSNSNSNPQPVIYIARAGSDQYRYSESLPTPRPSGIGNGVGNNLNNGLNVFQTPSPFGTNGTQNSGSSSGFFSNQNQNQNPSTFSGLSNPGSFSGGLSNNGNHYSQNQQGNTGSFNGFNEQNPNTQTVLGSNNNQNNQNLNSGLSGQSSGQFGSQIQGNLPFGPNMIPSNGQFGPQPFQPNQVGSIRQSPQFPEKDWNFQPGSQSVHYIGGGSSGFAGASPQGGQVPMTDEAQQIAVQINAIRDNLSITRDESNYLISHLKASLPQELQNQLQLI